MRTGPDSLLSEGETCRVCRSGKVFTAKNQFKLVCSACRISFDKRCPCYYDRRFCRGCQYMRVCSRRIGVKIFRVQAESEAYLD